jgi:glycosyltransferase involved in cell wall biosynthesis
MEAIHMMANDKLIDQKKPLVSIVTPFFNTVEYLDECIQSVLNQTYLNVEYILVDNCSTDRSNNIVERYIFNDKIKYYREKIFVNQIDNYNRALKYISRHSKYCKIVQADDWIFPNCLEEMVRVAESDNSIGLVSSYSIYQNHVGHQGLYFSEGEVYSGLKIGKQQLIGGNGLFGSPTCVLYRSDIVRLKKEFFSTETPYFEDTEICFNILREFNFGFVFQVLSFNRREKETIIHKMEQFGALKLQKILLIELCGEHFLEKNELLSLKKAYYKEYYYLLATNLLYRSSKEFWKFHAIGLKRIQGKIKWWRVFICTISLLLGLALNPVLLTRKIIEKIRKFGFWKLALFKLENRGLFL